jgi:Protein of unknown function (DUF2950)
LTPLIAQAGEKRYPGELVSRKPAPYRDYSVRILTGQGGNAAERVRNYPSDGRMTNGFALMAGSAKGAR